MGKEDRVGYWELGHARQGGLARGISEDATMVGSGG